MYWETPFLARAEEVSSVLRDCLCAPFFGTGPLAMVSFFLLGETMVEVVL
jgi:hypothetical protein